MEEIFKPIKNYENLYSISNLGRVKSNNRQRLGAGVLLGIAKKEF